MPALASNSGVGWPHPVVGFPGPRFSAPGCPAAPPPGGGPQYGAERAKNGPTRPQTAPGVLRSGSATLCGQLGAHGMQFGRRSIPLVLGQLWLFFFFPFWLLFEGALKTYILIPPTYTACMIRVVHTFGPVMAVFGAKVPKPQNGRISGWAARIVIPRAFYPSPSFGGFHPLSCPQCAPRS